MRLPVLINCGTKNAAAANVNQKLIYAGMLLIYIGMLLIYAGMLLIYASMVLIMIELVVWYYLLGYVD
jgi:hypothetical protein